jgi:transcriptional regulator with XRE-family HTH domain
MNIGEKISQVRKSKRFSQEYVGEKLGISRQSVSLWETNQTTPSMDNLIQLSKLFEIELNDLVQDNISTDENVEPIAISKFAYSDSIFNDTTNEMFKKTKTFTLVSSIVLLWVTIVFLIDEIHQNDFFAIITILLVILGILRFQFSKRKFVTNAQKKMKINPNVEMVFLFFEEYLSLNIQNENSRSDQKIKYNDLDKIIETGNNYFFIYSNTCYTVPKIHLNGNIVFLNELLITKTSKYISQIGNIENNSSNKSIEYIERKRKVSTTIFIINLFDLVIALMLFALYQGIHPNSTTFGFVLNTWIFYMVLPLPLFSIYYGLRIKGLGIKWKRNVIVGIIMSSLLVIYGSFFIIFGSAFTYDYSYINQVESIIDFELPDVGKITTYTYDSMGDSIGVKKESAVLFLDHNEITNLILRINTSDKWTTEITSINFGLLPKFQQIRTNDFNFFTIYNVTLDNYNSFPNSSGKYDFIFIAYNIDSGQMHIIEYSLEIVI